jgi:hypothetical protein
LDSEQIEENIESVTAIVAADADADATMPQMPVLLLHADSTPSQSTTATAAEALLLSSEGDMLIVSWRMMVVAAAAAAVDAGPSMCCES